MDKALKHIEYLKLGYDKKIADCDSLIEHQRKAIRVLRRSEGDDAHNQRRSLRKEMAVTNAQKQAYYQAKVDIDSVIDYLDHE